MIVSLTQPDGEPKLAEEALEIAQAHRNGYEIGHALIAVGIAWYRTEPEAAVTALDEAVQMSSRSLLPGTLVQAQFFRGLAHLRLRNTAQASADLSAAVGQAHVIGNDYYVAMILTAAAGLLSRVDTRQETAIRILAAADRLRDEAGLTGAPRDLAMQQRIADGLAEAQDPGSFQRAWTAGRQARLEDVIGLARSALNHIADLVTASTRTAQPNPDERPVRLSVVWSRQMRPMAPHLQGDGHGRSQLEDPATVYLPGSRGGRELDLSRKLR